VGLLLFEVLGDGNAGIPFLLAESEVVGVDQLVDLLLDGARVHGDVLLREELFLLVIVHLVVLDRPDLRLPRLPHRHQLVHVFLLRYRIPTSFFSRFSYASFTNISFIIILLFQRQGGAGA
jgi:hypothetical protein